MATLASHTTGSSYDNMNANTYEGQSFVVTQNGDANAIAIDCSKGSTYTAGTNITFSIRTGGVTGTVLVSKTFSADSLQTYNGSSTTWTTFTFDSSASLSTGTTYYFRYDITGSGGDVIRRSLDNGNNYPDGSIYFNSTSPTTSYDARFYIYGDVAATSKPNLLMLGVG